MLDKLYNTDINNIVHDAKTTAKETVRSFSKNTYYADLSSIDLSQIITENAKPLRLLGNVEGAFFSAPTDVTYTDFQGSGIKTNNFVAILAYIRNGDKKIFGNEVREVWKNYHTNTENIPQLDQAIFTIEEGNEKLTSILGKGVNYVTEGNKEAIEDAKVALRVTESTIKLLRYKELEGMPEQEAREAKNKTTELFYKIAEYNPYFYEVANAMLIMEPSKDHTRLKELIDEIKPKLGKFSGDIVKSREKDEGPGKP
ncbi:MAG: hypothetical protein K0R98_807 [Rickettsiaceae bacterium]|jgi:hypothetical protein|nr:hypothetical protein [Rickettsiaceae bacterium]